MTMAFAIEEINKDSTLLPNLTLGYSLHDNCGALVVGFSASLSMAGGSEEQFLLPENCVGTPPVLGIVGDSLSTFTIATSHLLGLYNLPIVSDLSLLLYFVFVFIHTKKIMRLRSLRNSNNINHKKPRTK